MIDKSVPYIPFVMKRDACKPIPEYELPKGYRYVFYSPGDEKDWAGIETSVLEFDCEMDALLYFQDGFLSHKGEAERRCFFIETDNGEKIANSAAWWAYTGTRRDPIVHWVAVKPDYQGKGLGKAIVSKTLKLLVEIEGDRDFYLSTQTNSHTAVFIYEWAGFVISGEKGLIGKKNDEYDKAVAFINSKRK